MKSLKNISLLALALFAPYVCLLFIDDDELPIIVTIVTVVADSLLFSSTTSIAVLELNEARRLAKSVGLLSTTCSKLPVDFLINLRRLNALSSEVSFRFFRRLFVSRNAFAYIYRRDQYCCIRKDLLII